MNLTNVIAFVASLGVGCGVLYANPKRAINRAFFLASLNVTAWLLSLSWLTDPANPNPVLWIRITSAIGSFIPFLLWIIKDCAKGGGVGWGQARSGWHWLVAAMVMAALCFTHYFIPAESTREHQLRGYGWSVFAIVNGAAYFILLVQAIYELRSCEGIHKIEMQTLLFGGTSAGIVGIALATLGPIFGMSKLASMLPMVITAFYAFTAWAITTQKVFDARHLFRSGLRSGLSIGAVSVIIVLAIEIRPEELPKPIVVIFCAVAITIILDRLNLRILRATLLGGDREGEGVRGALHAAGRDEFDREVLVRRFAAILEAWGRTNHAYFIPLAKEHYALGEMKLPLASEGCRELLTVSWATPESLLRQREASGRRELSDFMMRHGLGVIICAPSDDGRTPFLLALQVRRDRGPFTWSEIKFLQDWVNIVENTLSRISLTQQARESEQLRTAGLLGASLAHEIRNPLVTLKTIAQSAKARYNDPEFRRLLIELVPAEIERIEGLVSGLMDLGRPQYPHFETVGLNEVVETSVKLVRPKAQDEAVSLTCVLEAVPDEINADRASIRQIILNLVMNAIQAVSANEGKREVRVRTSCGDGKVFLEVADNGPGMPEDMRERLFQPFTTSNKTSGIGLGLAITADLAKLHHGQINLVEGGAMGTTFRVTLPCQQPSF
jgi:signal transduction histidine kinase